MTFQALTKLHQEPGHARTTEIHADEFSASRAILSRRFLAMTGDTPGNYLTRRRMDLAAIGLRDTTESLEAIANAIGYTSVYAFFYAWTRVLRIVDGPDAVHRRSIARHELRRERPYTG